MFFLNGTNDFAYPLDSYTRTYKLIKSQKNIRITVNMLHSHTHGWEPPEIGIFVDSHLRDGAPLPTAATPRITGRRVEMKVKAGTTLVEAYLHFTTDTGEVNKRTWLTRRASLNGKTVVADAPPPGTTIWFLTIRDERGAVVSSEPAFVR
jgi:hypothetical protein